MGTETEKEEQTQDKKVSLFIEMSAMGLDQGVIGCCLSFGSGGVEDTSSRLSCYESPGGEKVHEGGVQEGPQMMAEAKVIWTCLPSSEVWCFQFCIEVDTG